MAKVILTKESRMADRIIKCLPKQVTVAKALGESPQLISYRMKNIYPKQISELITLLDLAGYEIREKE